MKGIVLEGVSASGKSTILRLIQNKILEEYPTSTKLFISEHYTQRMLEHELEAQKLTADHIRNHTNQIIHNLSIYQEMLDRSKFAKQPSGADIFVTLERFLLTFLATHSDKMKSYPLDEANRQFNKLNEMNIRQYLLVLSEQALKEHINRTLSHRNDQWSEYVKKRGGIDGIAKESLEWQNNFLNLIERFGRSIKTEIISIEDWDYEKVADFIYDNEYSS